MLEYQIASRNSPPLMTKKPNCCICSMTRCLAKEWVTEYFGYTSFLPHLCYSPSLLRNRMKTPEEEIISSPNAIRALTTRESTLSLSLMVAVYSRVFGHFLKTPLMFENSSDFSDSIAITKFVWSRLLENRNFEVRMPVKH